MPKEVPIDYKLFTIPTVVVQNLNINNHVPAPSPELQALCKLPQVQLEDLKLVVTPPTAATSNSRARLNMTPPTVRPKIPRVSLEKLNLGPIEQAHTSLNPPKKAASNLDDSFLKVPVVLLTRCEQLPGPPAPPPAKRKVSFSLPTSKELPSHNRLPLIDLSKYTLVGPLGPIPIRDCRVRVRRDNLPELRSLLKKNKKPTTCRLCGKVYLSRKKLSYHQERKHDLVPSSGPTEKKKRVSFSKTVIVHTMPYHRCRKCLKVFKTYKILKSHMKSQHRKRTCYVCDYCVKLFADRLIFKLHIKLHCERCGELFADKRELIRHRKTKCIIRRIHRVKCASCEETYFSNLALKDHSYSHMDDKKLICDYCKDHFSKPCTLIQHLQSSHSTSKSKFLVYALVKNGSLKLYTCSFCADTFIDESGILKHLEDGESSQFPIPKKYGGHKCEHCQKKFKIGKNLREHMRTHVRDTEKHDNAVETGSKPLPGINDAPEPPNNIIQVDNSNKSASKIEDPKSYKYENNNKQNCHEMIAGCRRDLIESNKLVTCYMKEMERKERRLNGVPNGADSGNTEEPVPTRQRIKLIQHMCPICRKGYSSKSSLTRHERLHGSRCSECEEVFAWPSLLRAHHCLRSAAPPEQPFDDVRPEVPLITPDYMTNSLGMDDELPATNDITTQVDFEIPAPTFEFAAIPEMPYVGYFNREDAFDLAPSHPARGTKYRVVRQELPIEF